MGCGVGGVSLFFLLSANACLLDAELDNALAADLLRQLQQDRPKVVSINAGEHAAEDIFHTCCGGGNALELLHFPPTAPRQEVKLFLPLGCPPALRCHRVGSADVSVSPVEIWSDSSGVHRTCMCVSVERKSQ